MKLKAIIFDLDGTIAETEELHRQAFNGAFEKLKLNWFWDKSIYKRLLQIGGGVERLQEFQKNNISMNNWLSKEEINQIHTEKVASYTKIMGLTKVKPRPGILDLISQARSRNIKVAIATASSSVSANTLSKAIWRKSIGEVFECFVSGDEVDKKKPAPDIYLLALKKLSLKAKQCIAIEDSRTGLLSAYSAGIRTIIFPNNYTKHEDFSEADFICASIKKNNLPAPIRDQLFAELFN